MVSMTLFGPPSFRRGNPREGKKRRPGGMGGKRVHLGEGEQIPNKRKEKEIAGRSGRRRGEEVLDALTAAPAPEEQGGGESQHMGESVGQTVI